MNWIEGHLPQIVAVAVVLILLNVGRGPLLGIAKSKPWAMWIAWAVTALCGLILGWALFDLVAWATGLRGFGGYFVGTAGAIVALILGWRAVYLLVALIRDVADKRPDEDARKAALWVPTFLPAGGAAVWGVAANPRGSVTGWVAALIAGISIISAHMIVKAALGGGKPSGPAGGTLVSPAARAGIGMPGGGGGAGKTATRAWRWFAAAVCFLAGLATTPVLAYLDGWAARHFDPLWLVSARVLVGATGAAMGIAAARDLADKVPDKYVRAFLSYGLPAILVAGAVSIAWISGAASDGSAILTGAVR